jgi:hypothetical protein
VWQNGSDTGAAAGEVLRAGAATRLPLP